MASSHLVEGLRILPKGGTAHARLEDIFEVVRSMLYGHVVVVLGAMRKLGLTRIIEPDAYPEWNWVLGMGKRRGLAGEQLPDLAG